MGFSSRTLPGQAYSMNIPMASSVIRKSAEQFIYLKIIQEMADQQRDAFCALPQEGMTR